MKILVTGARGFLGRNLICTLKSLMINGHAMHKSVEIEEIFEFSHDMQLEKLDYFAGHCDFVFHFAGINRAFSEEEFMEGNYAFTKRLLQFLEKHHNTCPIVLASSAQTLRENIHRESYYAESKLAAEDALFQHEEKTGAKALVYRFPNVFGKWCRPDYNSVVATFCRNAVMDIPLSVNNPGRQMELLYIDDLLEEMLEAMKGNPHRCRYDREQPVDCRDGSFCYVPQVYHVSLQFLAQTILRFKRQEYLFPNLKQPAHSFEKKLYATYISYLPADYGCVLLENKTDKRGSFCELMRTEENGQISVNICCPGMEKGHHWHHTKWEIFLVISGCGIIRQREIGSDVIREVYVSGDRPEAVYILPGNAHALVNCSQSRDLITIIWASEPFDPLRPDTYHEQV